MGIKTNELNKRKQDLIFLLDENGSKIEGKLSELKELKQLNENLQKEQNEIKLQIKSNEDFIKDEISGLNESYGQFGFSFECPNPDTVFIKKDGNLIDGYSFNNESKTWEYNNNLPYCQLDTLERVRYFKNIENIFDTISKF
jgi:hypothetical protein